MEECLKKRGLEPDHVKKFIEENVSYATVFASTELMQTNLALEMLLNIEDFKEC